MCASSTLAVPALQATANDLVIIGGGSTAATILIRLRDELQSAGHHIPLRIHCFDPHGFPNGGIAYGRCSPHDILNSVRTEMSPWRTDGFHEWCLKQGIGGCKSDFNPRADYQAFLRDEIADCVRDLEALGVAFHQYRHDVRIEGEKNNFYTDIVDTKTGQPFITGCHASQIVIAAGYGPNKNFAALKESASPHYLHSIYEGGDDLLRGHPLRKKEKPQIVFIGSGPALFDQVNRLHGEGLSHAHLTVFTGSEKPLIGGRDVSIEAGQQNIVPESMLSIKDATASSLRRAIIRDFRRATSPRRAALDILRHIHQPLCNLSVDESRRFLQSGFIEWLKHTATPVPPDSRRRLNALDHTIINTRLNEKALRVRTDCIEVATPYGTITADLVINGTGHGRHNAPILEDLKRRNLAHYTETTDSLATSETGYRLHGSYIACIGPATHIGCDGVESFDMPAQHFVKKYVELRKSPVPAQILTFPHG